MYFCPEESPAPPSCDQPGSPRHRLNFLPLGAFSSPQICRIQGRSLFPARGRQCDPEDSGVSGACGPDHRWTAGIEDLSHWCENEAGKSESAAANAVSKKLTRRNTYDMDKYTFKMSFFDCRDHDTDIQLSPLGSGDEEELDATTALWWLPWQKNEESFHEKRILTKKINCVELPNILLDLFNFCTLFLFLAVTNEWRRLQWACKNPTQVHQVWHFYFNNRTSCTSVMMLMTILQLS